MALPKTARSPDEFARKFCQQVAKKFPITEDKPSAGAVRRSTVAEEPEIVVLGHSILPGQPRARRAR